LGRLPKLFRFFLFVFSWVGGKDDGRWCQQQFKTGGETHVLTKPFVGRGANKGRTHKRVLKTGGVRGGGGHQPQGKKKWGWGGRGGGNIITAGGLLGFVAGGGGQGPRGGRGLRPPPRGGGGGDPLLTRGFGKGGGGTQVPYRKPPKGPHPGRPARSDTASGGRGARQRKVGTGKGAEGEKVIPPASPRGVGGGRGGTGLLGGHAHRGGGMGSPRGFFISRGGGRKRLFKGGGPLKTGKGQGARGVPHGGWGGGGHRGGGTNRLACFLGGAQFGAVIRYKVWIWPGNPRKRAGT